MDKEEPATKKVITDNDNADMEDVKHNGPASDLSAIKSRREDKDVLPRAIVGKNLHDV